MTLGVGCSLITGRIFVGQSKKVNDNGTRMWTGNRIDVTDQAVGAVAMHLHVKLHEGETIGDAIVVTGMHADGTKFMIHYEEHKEERKDEDHKEEELKGEEGEKE